MKKQKLLPRKRFAVLLLTVFGIKTSALAFGSFQVGDRPYQLVQAEMQRLALSFPSQVTVVDIGPSDSGEGIQGLQIGHGPHHHLVVATHHGNEAASTKLALALSAELAAHPIPDLTVFVVPVLNIGGYDLGIRTEPLGDRQLDTNRDYPSPCKNEDQSFVLKSTRSLDHFMNSKNIISALSLHSPFMIATYPWSLLCCTYPNDRDEFHRYASVLTQFSSYATGTSGDLIFYQPEGVFEDYAYWKYGIWAFLIEVGPRYDHSGEEMQKIISQNVPGIRAFLQTSPRVRSIRNQYTGTCRSADDATRLDLHNE